MLQEARQIVELLHRDDEFLQVLKPPRRLGRLVVHQHLSVAALIEHHFGQFRLRQAVPPVAVQRAPAFEIRHHAGQRTADVGAKIVRRHQFRCGAVETNPRCACGGVKRLHRGISDAALGLVDDTLEGQVVVGLMDHAQIGQRVAQFHALVEARAADDAIGQT